MEPTIFKISELLTLSEEFAHFSCFRQCHVNLLKNLSEIDEDENVDWFDRVKVLDSNILSLINGKIQLRGGHFYRSSVFSYLSNGYFV